MRTVKSSKELRAEWGKLRRSIVPKIGQLTNDPVAISRIVCRNKYFARKPLILLKLVATNHRDCPSYGEAS